MIRKKIAPRPGRPKGIADEEKFYVYSRRTRRSGRNLTANQGRRRR